MIDKTCNITCGWKFNLIKLFFNLIGSLDNKNKLKYEKESDLTNLKLKIKQKLIKTSSYILNEV